MSDTNPTTKTEANNSVPFIGSSRPTVGYFATSTKFGNEKEEQPFLYLRLFTVFCNRSRTIMYKSREHQISPPLSAFPNPLDIKAKHINLPNDKRYNRPFIWPVPQQILGAIPMTKFENFKGFLNVSFGHNFVCWQKLHFCARIMQCW